MAALEAFSADEDAEVAKCPSSICGTSSRISCNGWNREKQGIDVDVEQVGAICKWGRGTGPGVPPELPESNLLGYTLTRGIQTDHVSRDFDDIFIVLPHLLFDRPSWKMWALPR